MLTLVGLGLRDGDVSRRGIDAVAAADIAYAELYTNSIAYDIDGVAETTGTPVEELSRDQVEDADRIVEEAETRDVAFLVSGDPLVATTHQDILFRARARGIDTAVVHAPSILTAVAETGLSSYKFGRTTTLPDPYDGDIPASPFDVIAANREQGLHTLLLLDIGMAVGEALDLVESRLDGDLVACAELGTADRRIASGSIDELREMAFGLPACLVVPGDLSDNERERLDSFK
ncbi:MAG: diphthine synthase [Candidatus Nanohaloarchaea archaeon]